MNGSLGNGSLGALVTASGHVDEMTSSKIIRNLLLKKSSSLNDTISRYYPSCWVQVVNTSWGVQIVRIFAEKLLI